MDEEIPVPFTVEETAVMYGSLLIAESAVAGIAALMSGNGDGVTAAQEMADHGGTILRSIPDVFNVFARLRDKFAMAYEIGAIEDAETEE